MWILKAGDIAQYGNNGSFNTILYKYMNKSRE